MIKLKEGERTLVKKWLVICTICIIAGGFFVNIPQKPKLISSITTMDTAYLTILVDKTETKNLEELKKKIIYLCKTDGFKEIKLKTDDKESVKKYYISIYTGEKELEEGREPLTILYEDK